MTALVFLRYTLGGQENLVGMRAEIPCMLGGGGSPSLAAPSSGEGWKSSERVGEEKERERGGADGRLTGGVRGAVPSEAGQAGVRAELGC